MKKLVVISLELLLLTTIISCDKQDVRDDISPIMEDFYIESIQLPTVTLDSVRTFSNKLDGFTLAYPLAKEHKRYPMIKENIKAASIRISIDIDTVWSGETYINF